MATQESDASRPPAGLRERSKVRRRNQILRAALRLFAENGYEATTIADIAAAAELAPRTVTGYFPNKIDMATAVGDGMTDRLADALTSTENIDFVTTVDRWITTEFLSADDDALDWWRLAGAALGANPQLGPVGNSHQAAAATAGANLIAQQTGIPADHPTIAICMGAYDGALGVYLGHIVEHGPDPQLHQWFLDVIATMIRAVQPTERTTVKWSTR